MRGHHEAFTGLKSEDVPRVPDETPGPSKSREACEKAVAIFKSVASSLRVGRSRLFDDVE